MNDIELKEIDAGLEIIRVLDLKVKPNGRVDTTHGDKTALGLARTMKDFFIDKPVLLSDDLIGSARGLPTKGKYRAMMAKKGSQWTVTIEQSIRDEWHVCGRWNLNTLLYGYPLNLGHKPSDSLSIDYGQEWQIDKGMQAALSEAINHI